jgi:hypothetical protein
LTDEVTILGVYRSSTMKINGIVAWYQLVRWWARIFWEGRKVGREGFHDWQHS